MHWFWRAAIAVVVSYLALTVIDFALNFFLFFSDPATMSFRIVRRLAELATPLVIFGLLNRWYAPVRIPPGHCQKCGYNLTGNVSGVCPECGEKI
ncbi:MAG: hypothetical protein ACUVXJ_06675 [Phycisphaerae bacterium]